MKLIVEVWCSPLRGEIYGHSYIAKSTSYDFPFDEELSMYFHHNFFEDIFGHEHETIKGLWKVVFELKLIYSKDYWGECDVDYAIEKDPYKSKCDNWSEIKQIWLGLSGKGEEYFNKPYKKNSGLFQFESV